MSTTSESKTMWLNYFCSFLAAANINMVVPAMGGIFCLIPIYFQSDENFVGSPLKRSLSSNLFRESSISCIALAVPLLLDTLFDFVNAVVPRKRTHKSIAEGLLNCCERVMFLIGILIVPLVAFLPNDTRNLALVYVCFSKLQLQFVAGAVIASLCRHDKNYWYPKMSFCTILSLSIGTVIDAWNDNAFVSRERSKSAVVFGDISFAFTLTSAILLAYMSFRWLIIMIKAEVTLFYMTPKGKFRSCSFQFFNSEKFFPLVYVATILLSFLLLICFGAYFQSVSDYDAYALCISNMSFIMLLLFMSVISMRMMKFEILQGLFALIDSKKSYVRYISHELRTPLNSACLGLKLINDNMQQSSAIEDMDRCETLRDINSACKIAVDILNDLLCFDKLESGILKIHKHEVSVIPFIVDCVSMFASQAKEAGIKMTIETDAGGRTPHTQALEGFRGSRDSISVVDSPFLPIKDSDTVFIDKFKMDQVLRNLVSNALKFTPRGGNVAIKVAFLPDTDIKKAGLMSGLEVQVGKTKPIKKIGTNLQRLCGAVGTFFGRSTAPFFKLSRRCLIAPDIEEGFYTPEITNYLQNYSEKNHQNPDISDDVRGKLVITVTDDGAGMSVGNQQKLFTEIIQFNPETLQAGGGCGLGLFITSNIVTMHGGMIGVHSEGEGLGAVFTVNIGMVRKRPRIAAEAVETLDLVKAPEQSTDITPASTLIDAFTSATPAHTDDFADDIFKQYPGLSNLDSRRPGDISSFRKENEDQDMKDKDRDSARHRMRDEETVVVGNSYRGSSVHSAAVMRGARSPRQYISAPTSLSQSSRITELRYDILIVDDSRLNRKMLCKLMVSYGHRFDEADDGIVAVEKIKKKISLTGGQKNSYDIVLMDFVMPNMDGPQAAKEIRALGYEGLIFGVTGNALESDKNHFLASGANRVLVKPLDIEEFEQAMRECSGQGMLEGPVNEVSEESSG